MDKLEALGIIAAGVGLGFLAALITFDWWAW